MRVALLCLFIAILCFILLIEVNSCAAQDKLLRCIWIQYDNPVDAENVDYYVLYKWSGDTSSVFHVDSLVLVDTVAQMVTVNEFERSTYFPMNKWIRAALVAHDDLGRKSDYAFTRFYAPPEDPKEIRIEQ